MVILDNNWEFFDKNWVFFFQEFGIFFRKGIGYFSHKNQKLQSYPFNTTFKFFPLVSASKITLYRCTVTNFQKIVLGFRFQKPSLRKRKKM